ncbi:MAG TPA: ATP-binding protein [Steroidobacteraceae bacterium]|jgi:nitrogen fixation/metabolism regulation signal transduction histidine kinase
MGFSSFRFNVLLRGATFAWLSLLAVWSALETQFLATPILCGVLALLSLVEMIGYVERTTRDLATFLTFVTHDDFSTPIVHPSKGRAFGELHAAYDVLSGALRRLNQQKAANHRQLEAVVAHVPIALCCFDQFGKVTLSNEQGQQLFNLPHLNSMRSFERVDARLPDMLSQLNDGERAMLSVRVGDESLQLVLYATTFELLEQQYKLVSFQNIRDELDRQEIDSWQKLIRVLTHEIMNSVTPILALSGVIRETLLDESETPTLRTLSPSEHSDVLRGITAIHTRGKGLLDFVQAYRSFARLPTPEFAPLDVYALFERVRILMSAEVDSGRIALVLECTPRELQMRADARQIEQVLINLMRNAVEALSDTPKPRIHLDASRNEYGQVLVHVYDNGPGISADHVDNIFVPFFTTKRSGTGVGLSICRQLVHANRGVISVRSVPGEGTVFTLRFR